MNNYAKLWTTFRNSKQNLKEKEELKMNKHLKKFLAATMGLTLAITSAISASACTGIYVGNKVSENGSTFIGRSEDLKDMHGKVYETVPAKDWEKGSMYKDAYGFSMPNPSHTYAYTCVRDSYANNEYVTDENGNPTGQPYAAAGMNEKSVAATATVSTYYNQAAKKADPLVDTGICEISMVSVILGSAKSAKDGVKLLAKIVDTYGAGECNALVISDSHEAWYMEIVSGHQYAAIKLPDDKVGVNPNTLLLGEINVTDTENVIVSKDLVKLAKDNGFFKTGENGMFHVALSYGNPTSLSGRYYQGVYYVNPEEADKLNPSEENPLSLFVDPAKKLSTLEVLQYLAYRGQGSKMDTDKTGTYPIGNNRQTECHVFEIRSNMPQELATIEWLAMADAEFSVFVPFYGTLLTETNALYQKEGNTFQEDSINWNFQKINHLCDKNRDKNVGKNVKAYFETYQESLIEQQKAIDADMVKILAQDKNLAKEKATALGNSLAEQIFAMSKTVLQELEAYLAAGDFSKEFVPSAMTEKVMPKYSFAEIGGTGLVETDVPTDDSVQNVEPQTDGTVDTAVPEIPKTGAEFAPLSLFVLSAAAGTACVLLKKQKKND